MEDKHVKILRILDLYVRFCEGKIINKTEEAQYFGVNERSIQRDIDDIRAFLDERKTSNSSDNREIVYDRAKKGFIMKGVKGSVMSNGEVLAITKILLESRAFTKEELNDILSKLVDGCVPLTNMKLISDLIANEKYHYVELHHKTAIHDRLWKVGENIREHNLLEIKYTKADSHDETIKRIIEPVGILFSEYYFYLNAYIDVEDDKGKYVHKYDYPAIFRLDRIKSYKKLGEKFQIPYSSRFEEGEFRKRIQFMYAGELMIIRLKYYGNNPEHILDRLPTARIIRQCENEIIIEAEVYGKGILMWLLSQGSNIEVLKPDALRQEMRQRLLEILDRY